MRKAWHHIQYTQHVWKVLVGASKFETAKVKLSFRASEAVEITDQNEIPKDFLVEKVTVAPDKAAIKAAIKNGIYIPGAEIVRKENLQIK